MRCPGTLVTVNADLDRGSLKEVSTHWLPSYCTTRSHEKTVGMPSTKTILWPSVLNGNGAKAFQLHRK